jgi:hypothetical protein
MRLARIDEGDSATPIGVAPIGRFAGVSASPLPLLGAVGRAGRPLSNEQVEAPDEG